METESAEIGKELTDLVPVKPEVEKEISVVPDENEVKKDPLIIIDSPTFSHEIKDTSTVLDLLPFKQSIKVLNSPAITKKEEEKKDPVGDSQPVKPKEDPPIAVASEPFKP